MRFFRVFSWKSDTRLQVGRAKYMPAGLVNFAEYESGETVIEIVDKKGTQLYVATVALVPYGAPHPGENCVWLKGWSENEGVPEALAGAGIVILTGHTCSSDLVTAQHALLTQAARVQRDRQAAHR